MNSSGDILICVVLSRHVLFSCSTTLPAPSRFTRSLAIADNGYYSLVSFLLNVDQTPLPLAPLAPLPK
jgi:hypothetical protein